MFTGEVNSKWHFSTLTPKKKNGDFDFLVKFPTRTKTCEKAPLRGLERGPWVVLQASI